MSISVVYLARGKSAEKLSAIQFINSYQKYQSGCDHILCVVMKGWEKDDMKEYNEFRRKFLNIGAKIFDYDDDNNEDEDKAKMKMPTKKNTKTKTKTKT